MNIASVTALLLTLLGVAACGEERAAYKPLDAVEREAVGTYRIDLVHEVTEKQRHDLASIELVLRADRSFGKTRWDEEKQYRITVTGEWSLEAKKLILGQRGFHPTGRPELRTKERPEPLVEEVAYKDGAIRLWPHRPYLLRRVK